MMLYTHTHKHTHIYTQTHAQKHTNTHTQACMYVHDAIIYIHTHA